MYAYRPDLTSPPPRYRRPGSLLNRSISSLNSRRATKSKCGRREHAYREKEGRSLVRDEPVVGACARVLVWGAGAAEGWDRRYSPPHPAAVWPLTANILDPIRLSIVCQVLSPPGPPSSFP
jgi:hypothetical protein